MSMTPAEKAELEALRAENAKMKADNEATITIKLGQKGTVAVYHGGRWPVSLYASQWERLLPFFKTGKVEEFIKANEAKVSRK